MRVCKRTWGRAFGLLFSRFLGLLRVRHTGLRRPSAFVAQIPALPIARVLDAITPMLALRRLIAGFGPAALGGIGCNLQDCGDGGSGEDGGENGGCEFGGST
jgi:hypothetical protein